MPTCYQNGQYNLFLLHFTNILFLYIYLIEKQYMYGALFWAFSSFLDKNDDTSGLIRN